MDKGTIEVRDLSKVYHLYNKPSDRIRETFSIRKKKYSKEHYALKNINLKINKGESIGIVGTNGSGKSTLLKLVTGVVTPTTGTIKTDGKIAALLELGAGFNPEYTGIENIYLNGTMMGYTEEEMKKRVPDIIEFADIGEFINQPVKSYSSGMFARLAFAVSINVEPDILIVDEALSVGDTRFQVKCIDKMRELQESGTTILFVTHAIEQIKRFCTRAIWIKNGELIEDGEASQVVDLYDNFMKYGEKKIEKVNNEDEFRLPENSDYLAVIQKVSINKNMFKTFEKLEVEVTYDVYDNHMEDLQVGVAFYSLDRKIYVFGPNTNLDKISVPQKQGRHVVKYIVPELMLMGGDYTVDVGIFNSGGIVNLDYKNNCEGFSVANEYFSEGMFYLKHEWQIGE
ncbi:MULTISPECIES: ABC transporter ATP-binding protein [Clostridia]|uniref:Teichoic acid ABC transporter ATP-binding protein n=1 Tax=Butyribacter intestini TaxID=1703332 RepID=A0AAW3JQE8_9FIRM|nr:MULTISPECIES: ABC transporter ATP-binding protein [Clostridia]KQC84399.1 teichoic acid ABC transporter ATP-binding protein [Butyribacter intestini]RHP25260.1 ABC transporter ATP-binding protein [Clostridium sp. AF34-13]RHU72457.1 ABC transporter ATP-binding protein [Butyribacter intestini]